MVHFLLIQGVGDLPWRWQGASGLRPGTQQRMLEMFVVQGDDSPRVIQNL